MSLRPHLNIVAPVCWVVSDEPHRVLAEVITHAKRPVFRVDPLDGLVVFQDPNWKRVLITDENGGEVPTFSLGTAIKEVLDRRGILVIDHAHLSTSPQNPELIPFYSALTSRFLDAVRADNPDALPAQFILISCKDEIPVELTRSTAKITFALPDPDALGAILERFNAAVPDHNPAAVVRAGQGLSELEFTNALLRSLHDKDALDVEFINHLKVDIIKSGGLLEIRPPGLGLGGIGGLAQMKELITFTAWTWNHIEEAAALGIEPLRKFLLVGVPGSGKSAICEATAAALGLDLAKTGAGQTMSKWVGESEANMRRLFVQVAALAPIGLWIDEFGRDMSGSQSSGSVDAGTTDRVQGTFLTGLQELPHNVFLMCAANRIDGLPPEMLRADRFDKIVFVGLPTLTERLEIFRIHLGADAETHNLEDLASATPTFTGAEIKALVKEVRFRCAAAHQRRPTTDEFLAHTPKMKGRIWTNHRSAIQEMYSRALAEWDWASAEQEAEADKILSGPAAEVRSGHAAHRTPSPVPAFGVGARGEGL